MSYRLNKFDKVLIRHIGEQDYQRAIYVTTRKQNIGPFGMNMVMLASRDLKTSKIRPYHIMESGMQVLKLDKITVTYNGHRRLPLLSKKFKRYNDLDRLLKDNGL